MTDDARILAAAKAGKADAWADLIVRYNNLLRRVVAPYFIVGADRDDLMQEATLGLISAVKEFDPERGGNFASFAFSLARQNVIDAVRRSQRKKHSPLNNARPILALVNDEDGEVYNVDVSRGTEDPLDTLIDNETSQRLRRLIDESLTSREKQVLRLYLLGYTYLAVGEKLNISAKTVDNTLTNIRKKLRDKKDSV